MSRQSRREEIKAALVALGRFADVFEGARRSFGARSPVAVILSRSYAIQNLTRSLNDGLLLGFTVTIYVAADASKEDEAEDTLDQLLVLTADALRDAGFDIGESDAAPDNAPLRDIDKRFYRAERLPVSIEDYD